MVKFENWKVKYNKKYGADAHEAKFQIFKDNSEFIDSHNLEHSTMTLAENEFMDLTFEEFSNTHMGIEQTPEFESSYILGAESIPKHVDWREQGAVSRVKNQ